jgi:predicted phosphate transport protein (TIGR00153 family)
MLKWLLPKEDRFFTLFTEQATNVLTGAKALSDLVKNFTDQEKKAAQIHQIEHQGDNLAHTINNSLDATFVTPIDREDIHALASSIDKTIDFIDASAKRMVLMKLKKPTPEMIRLCELIERCAEELCRVVPKLSNPQFSEEIRIHLNEMVRLEKEGDQIHHAAIAKLFEEEKDPIKLIKIKEVTEFLEEAVDTFERVGHVIESIVVKNS